MNAATPDSYQQRARQWIEGVRRVGVEEGVIPLQVGDVSIDPLDALISPLILEGGRMLAALEGKHPSQRRPMRFQPRLALYRMRRLWGQIRAAYTSTPASCAPEPFVLMVPRDAGHLADQIPVAEQLQARHGIHGLFALTDGDLASHVVPFPAFNLYHLAGSNTLTAVPSAAQARRRILRAGQALRQKSDFDEREHTHLLMVTQRILSTSLADVVRLVYATTVFLDRWQPALLMPGNPYSFEGRVAALVGRARGIPVAVIEHGSVFVNDPVWQEAPVDLVCAWGAPSRDALLTCGMAPERIALTGAPRLDEIWRTHGAGHEARDPYILVATSGPGDQVSEVQHGHFIDLLYQAATRTPEVRWVVKLHRKDHVRYYEAVQARHPEARVEVVPANRARFGTDIFDYLRGARALVTVLSSTATDAMIVDVPVISVQVPGGRSVDEVAFLAYTRQVCDAATLAEAARQAWRNETLPCQEAARAYAARHFYHLGRASEVASDHLAGLIQQYAHAA